MTEHRGRKRSAPGERVPPHNLDAEQAMLGAALMAPAAAAVLLEQLRVDDFYRPAHQHIAHAIVHAGDAGPVDAVTVSEQLRRDGLLDEIGGLAYLAELQNATPSIGNAARYARIVRETAMLRRLIDHGAQVADLAYANPDDPSRAVAQAADLLADLGVHGAGISSLELANIADLLATDLQPEQPTLLRRADGGALLYGGKMHTFQAEPGAGKSWLSLWCAGEILHMGGSCIVIDNEDTATVALSRMKIIGVADRDVRERLQIITPSAAWDAAQLAELRRLLDRMNPDLVIVDGVANSLSNQGLSEDSAPDYVRWVNMLPRPIARTGAAVLLLDHVTKDPEQRGRWARGSGAKLGEIDGAAFQLKARIPFSRHRTGRTDVVVAKDRPGGVGTVGETVAQVTFDPKAAGEYMKILVAPHTIDVANTDSWKPTVLMGKVWAALNDSAVPLTATGVGSLVHSEKPRLVKEAIQRLIAEGYIAEVKSGRTRHLTIIRPYAGAGAPNGTAPAWRQPPPELPLDDTPADDSWIDDRYLDTLEHHQEH